jgi:hypothetical protein
MTSTRLLTVADPGLGTISAGVRSFCFGNGSLTVDDETRALLDEAERWLAAHAEPA